MIGARCLSFWTLDDPGVCGRALHILTAPITRLGSKASKSARLSEQALLQREAPRPSKLMTTARFLSSPVADLSSLAAANCSRRAVPIFVPALVGRLLARSVNALSMGTKLLVVMTPRRCASFMRNCG